MQGEIAVFEISDTKNFKKLGMLRESVIGYKAIYKQNENGTGQGWDSLASIKFLSAPLSRCGSFR